MKPDAELKRQGSAKMRTIALVGNPNSGKTSLFNALTGLRQKVGNYPGVTVERKEGTTFTQHGKRVRIVDLPGSYSLQPRSPDERILVDVLLGRMPGEVPPDVVLCIVDASNLERNLYLVTQVLELGLPMVVALNMMDIVERRGLKLDILRLEKALGVPVIPIEAARGKGLIELKLALSRVDLPSGHSKVKYPVDLEKAVVALARERFGVEGEPQPMERAEALLLLGAEDSSELLEVEDAGSRRQVSRMQETLDLEAPGWRSELITDRYAYIGGLVRDVVHRFNPARFSMTERVDRVLLHPLWGIGALLGVMGFLFYCIFSLAVPFMDGIDEGVGSFGEWVGSWMPEGELQRLTVDGAIAGVGAVLVFLPQILLLFFFISLLESTGYMARAAFILDRLMSKVGLHGRSFVPLLSSYACAVPGIMATRTIDSFKDRLVTILVAPFMTCSARLPVYLILIAALLPPGENHALLQAGLLLFLYVLGTVAALGFGYVFKKSLLRGAAPSMVMELPPYRLPQLRSVFLELWDRARVFLRRAGTIIFGLSIILWFLMNYPKVPEQMEWAHAGEVPVILEAESPDALEQSFAGRIGRAVEPVFRPLGYDWKMNVGILASFAAREVFVSTMAIIYRVEDEEDTSSLVETLRSQERADGTPAFTPLTCLSLMIFFVFALQCVATIAVVRRETNSWRWPLFQLGYMLAVAWTASFLVFQGGRLLGFS